MPPAQTAAKPELSPRRSGMLPVGQGHRIYWEEYGDPAGIPAVYVHGGPGGSISWKLTRYFDLRRYRVVAFEQRGCGRSTPRFSLKENTTPRLVADMELLRESLGVEKWLLFGGSWGSALSLFYAEAHPERVLGLILRGVFLGRPEDWNYLIRPSGAGLIKPAGYAKFLELVPPKRRHDPAAWYMETFAGKDRKLARAAGRAWAEWEGSLLFFRPKRGTPKPTTAEQRRALDDELLQLAMMECHYASHASFQEEENQILRRAHKIAHLPAWIVHGEYDLVCPPAQAYELGLKLPKAKLTMVRGAAHSGSEPGIKRALKRAVASFALRHGRKWAKKAK